MFDKEKIERLSSILHTYKNTDFSKYDFSFELENNLELQSLLPGFEVIGEGCTACVLKYEQYAIKCFYPVIGEEFEQYTVDYEVLSKLQGIEGVPTLYGGEDKLFIIMDYIDGKKELIPFYSKLPLENLIPIMRAIITIRDRGIIPLDLHEENVLVKDNRLYLIDFGAYEYKHNSTNEVIPHIIEYNNEAVAVWKEYLETGVLHNKSLVTQ